MSQSPGVMLHRVGFVMNTALQGAVAGVLLLLTVGLLAFYVALWQFSARPLSASWPITAMAGSFGVMLLGGLVGGSFGTWAGLRVSRWRGNPLPPFRRSWPGALLLIGLNGIALLLGLALIALLGGFNEDLAWWHLALLGILGAPLGAVIGGYVGIADRLTGRGLLYALMGALCGTIPASAAVAVLLGTPVAEVVPQRWWAVALVPPSGLLGGFLLGHLAEMLWRPLQTTAENDAPVAPAGL